MTTSELRHVLSMPLFSGLDETQLGCIEPGEVIELAAAAVLVSQGDKLPCFLLVLEGELRFQCIGS